MERRSKTNSIYGLIALSMIAVGIEKNCSHRMGNTEQVRSTSEEPNREIRNQPALNEPIRRTFPQTQVTPTQNTNSPVQTDGNTPVPESDEGGRQMDRIFNELEGPNGRGILALRIGSVLGSTGTNQTYSIEYQKDGNTYFGSATITDISEHSVVFDINGEEIEIDFNTPFFISRQWDIEHGMPMPAIDQNARNLGASIPDSEQVFDAVEIERVEGGTGEIVAIVRSCNAQSVVVYQGTINSFLPNGCVQERVSVQSEDSDDENAATSELAPMIENEDSDGGLSDQTAQGTDIQDQNSN